MTDIYYPLMPTVDMTVLLEQPLPIVEGQTKDTRSMVMQAGGLANTMIEAVRLGLSVLPVGQMGQDLFGDWLIEQYKEERIDTSRLHREPGFETQKVLVLADRQRAHAFVSMNRGAFGPLPVWRQDLQDSRALCLTGYHLACEDTCDQAVRMLKTAHQMGKLVFFDPGPTIAKLPPDWVCSLLPYCDYLVLTADEAAYLASGSAEEMAAALAAHGCQVVLKDGGRGCYLYRGNTGFWAPGYQVPVVDTTGAGDSFLAAFMLGVLSDLPLAATAALANGAGAAMVQKLGSGRMVPTVDEIAAVLEQRWPQAFGGRRVPQLLDGLRALFLGETRQ